MIVWAKTGVLLVVVGLALRPASGFAQIPAPGAQSFQSGCAGSGPGIIAGRVPNFSQETFAVARIVAGGPDGDAYVSEVRSEEASREWIARVVGDPKSTATFEKNPVSNPAALGAFKGDIHNTQAVMAFFASEQATMKHAINAAQSASTVVASKDAGH